MGRAFPRDGGGWPRLAPPSWARRKAPVFDRKTGLGAGPYRAAFSRQFRALFGHFTVIFRSKTSHFTVKNPRACARRGSAFPYTLVAGFRSPFPQEGYRACARFPDAAWVVGARSFWGPDKKTPPPLPCDCR